MSGRQTPRDFQFVNFSNPHSMRDASNRSMIRRHAMRVTGLARRRSRLPPDDLVNARLQAGHSRGSSSMSLDENDGLEQLDTIDVDEEDSAVTTSPIPQELGTVQRSPFVYGVQSRELNEPWVYDYAAHVMMAIRLPGDTNAVAAWSTAFLQDLMIFHATHWCASIHRNLLSKSKEWTSSRGALLHKAEAMRLLRQRLDRIEDNEVEWIIYAILCLARTDKQADDSSLVTVSLPFVPHVPSANWTNLYGKTELIDAHRHALLHLVRRQGGLHSLQIPGLGFGLALTDLQAASTTYHTPMFPKFWDIEVANLESSWTLSILLSPPVGRGFISLKGKALTEQAVKAFTDLSIVDRILSQRGLHWARETESTLLLSARNAAHHDLLCLLPWQSLDAESKELSNTFAYELCRLTCILYSNAVMMGLPPDNGWYRTLIQTLVGVFELSNFNLRQELSSLLIWSLFIVSVGAYELPERTFFEQHLRAVLSQHNVRQWSGLHGILQGFLWSDAACEIRAVDLWKNLGLEM